MVVTPPHPALAAIIAGKAALMIDCTGRALPGLLQALNGRYPDVLAGYVTGSAGVDWPGAEWGQLAPHVGLFRYDQSPSLSLFASGAADAGDIERGAGTVGAFVDACRKREARGWWSFGYISESGFHELSGEINAAGLRKVQYGIANWNDSLAAATATLGGVVRFVQWASPSTNPNTACPGTGGRTLAELNVDLNATVPGFFARTILPPPPPPPPPATKRGLLVTDFAGNLAGQVVTSADGKTWAAAG